MSDFSNLNDSIQNYTGYFFHFDFVSYSRTAIQILIFIESISLAFGEDD